MTYSFTNINEYFKFKEFIVDSQIKYKEYGTLDYEYIIEILENDKETNRRVRVYLLQNAK